MYIKKPPLFKDHFFLFQFLEGKLSSSIITSEYGRKAKGATPTKADEIVVTTFMTFFAYLYGMCVCLYVQCRDSMLQVISPGILEKG